MTSLTKRVELNLRALRPYAKQSIFILIVICIPLFIGREPYGMTATAAVMAAAFCPQYLFSIDERSRLDTLFVALGISKPQTVIGRYAACLFIMVTVVAIMLLASLGLAAVMELPLDVTVLGVLALWSIMFGGLIMCVQLPVFFAIGFTHARPVTIVSLAVLVATAVLPATLAPDFSRAAMEWFVTSNPVLLSLLALLILCASVSISAALSIRLYSRRDL